MELPAALSCVEMGYDKKLVQKAIEKYMEEKRKSLVYHLPFTVCQIRKGNVDNLGIISNAA